MSAFVLYYANSCRNKKCVHDVVQFKFFVALSCTKNKSCYVVGYDSYLLLECNRNWNHAIFKRKKNVGHINCHVQMLIK